MTADGIQRKRRPWRSAILAVMIASGVALVMRQGVIPAVISPLPAIDLAVADAWLVDWRLSQLKRDLQLCARVLRKPYIDAQAIADQALQDGCGWTNAVRVNSLSGARISTDKLGCEPAAALALWVAHDVQPLALEILGQPVTAIKHWGTYACRNVVGNPMFGFLRSAHATARAIDIGAFTLADGRQITVQRDWKRTGKESEFLHAIHKRSCRYFHVAIGPDYNAAHHDHFHLDRSFGFACK